LAVLPFTNNTGDKSLDVWKSALAELLIDNLSQSKYIYVLPKERLLTLMKEFNLREANGYSSEDLKKLVARGIGNHLLLGSFFKSGPNWRVNVTLKEAKTGEDIGNETEEGENDRSLFKIADALAAKVKKDLKLTGQAVADDVRATLENVTTSSPEAYAYFSQGFGFYSDMEYLKAIPLLERALEIDPKFAMAWRTLGACHYNRNRGDPKFKDYYKKAFELSEGLPPRERYAIQGEYYNSIENNPDKALEVVDKLLKDYPEHLLGNRLKYIAMDEKQTDWKISTELSEKNYLNFPENALECGNFIIGLCNSGDLQRAEEVARNFLKSYSDNAIIRRQVWLVDIYRGEFDLALSELEEAFKRFPSSHPNWFMIVSKGNLYMYRGDIDKAEQEYLKLVRAEDPLDKRDGFGSLVMISRLQGKYGKSRQFIDMYKDMAAKTETKADDANSYVDLAYLSFMKNDAQETLKNADEALRIGADNLAEIKKFYVLAFKGWAQARLKAFAEAEKAAAQLKTIAGNKRKTYWWYHLLNGWIEIERGRFDKALPELERVSVLYPKYYIYGGGSLDDRAFMIYPLALAYYKAGELDKAIVTYQEITRMTIGRRSSGDIYAKAFYMLGKIYEQKGEKAKAVENYRKFLDLWKNADPGLPEVEDARKRLAKRP
jgi:tetratricopeptide (TPR) repeat protein